jgi:hypothetical protein
LMKSSLKLGRRIDPTSIGVAMFYAYPIVVLLYDVVLKFALEAPTITARISEGLDTRLLACSYMVVWCIGLGLHFGLGWFGGFAIETEGIRENPFIHGSINRHRHRLGYEPLTEEE